MGEVRRNINLRLPSKSKASDYHPAQISPYTDRLVEELSSGRDSRTELRKAKTAPKSPTPTLGEEDNADRGDKQKRRLEEQVRQLTALVQEKSLKIENLELSLRTLKHQLEQISEEKYEFLRLDLTRSNLQLAAKAKSAYTQLIELKEAFENQKKEQPSISEELIESIEKYAKFFIHRIEDVPTLFQVFRDRGGLMQGFGKAVSEGEYPEALLGALQTLCDFIVSEGEKSRHLCDKSVQTIVHRPSAIEPEAKPSVAPSSKAAKPDREYMKMMNESDQLLATISAQSQRIANLNSQLYSTISQQTGKTSARLLDHYRGGSRKDGTKMKSAVSGKSSPVGAPKGAKIEEWEEVTWKRQSPSPHLH